MPSLERYALVIEDDVLYGELIARLLRQLGFIVEWVKSLADAKKLEGWVFELITIDLALPDSVGFSALTETRPIFPKATIMIISGYVDEKSAMQLIKLGADHCIEKPENIEEFKLEIGRALSMKDTTALMAKIERNTREHFNE